MANFIEEYKKGQREQNKGLPMGEGLTHVSSAINGVQKARIYGVAAAPKAGKSTFVDYAFVIQPILIALEHNVPLEVIYLSFEIDRVSKEFDFVTYFLFADYGIQHIQLGVGQTKDGKNIIKLNPDYLRGRMQDDENNIIKVKDKIFEAIKEIYIHRIIPIFGEWSVDGLLIKPGIITFIENKDNPTGLYKYFLKHAEKNGKFKRVQMGNSQRIVGYEPNDPAKFTIVVTDHLRKLLPERGFQKKQTVDKFIEYSVEIRNLCQYTFVHIIHLNRSMTQMDRLKTFSDLLYPNSDDIKDTGNLAEDADYVFTIFNPNDERYNLTQHFGKVIKDDEGNELYPDMRTIHLVESRHCSFPQHFRVNMQGSYKNFEKLIIP
tara:strand:+ start:578 stop:1705 length:1128 start_codon:yes stop_codon:yes gene_type:complete